MTERTAGEFDRGLSTAVVSRLTLEGVARRAATTHRIAENAMGGIEAALRERGVESLETVETTDPVPEGDGEIIEYRGTVEVPAITREIEVRGETRTVDLEGSPLAVDGLFTVRKADAGTAYVAGGVYPDENYVREESVSPSEAAGPDAEVTVDVDLDLDPGRLRERVIELIEGVDG